jgi:hypothetical protein
MRRATSLACAVVLAVGMSCASTPPPRFDIVDRSEARLLNGDIAYYVTLGRREPDGSWRQQKVRVPHITYRMLAGRSEACLYAGPVIRPCP